MGPAGPAGPAGDVGPVGPVGPKGDTVGALGMVDVVVDLTASATVPLAVMAPHSWVQTIMLSVEVAADAETIDVALLDDGSPLAFANVPEFTPPAVDVRTAGSVATWPGFMDVDGGELSLVVSTSGGTTGRLRVMIVHGQPAATP